MADAKRSSRDMIRNRTKPIERMMRIGVLGGAYRQVRGTLMREVGLCRSRCASPDRWPRCSVASELRQCNAGRSGRSGDTIRNRAKPVGRTTPMGLLGVAYRQVRGTLVREVGLCRGGYGSPDRWSRRSATSGLRQCNAVQCAMANGAGGQGRGAA